MVIHAMALIHVMSHCEMVQRGRFHKTISEPLTTEYTSCPSPSSAPLMSNLTQLNRDAHHCPSSHASWEGFTFKGEVLYHVSA